MVSVIPAIYHPNLPIKNNNSVIKMSNALIEASNEGKQFKGSLRQKDGNEYTLGDRKGVFHYKKENNSGFFTDPLTSEVVGYIFPFEGGDVAIYKMNSGLISHDLLKTPEYSNYIVRTDGMGNIVYMWQYVDGEGKEIQPPEL